MSSINTLYIKKETLETILKTLKVTDNKGIEITVSLNDEPNQWQQNVSAWVSQNKEQREDKKPRFFVGNGNTVWTDGKITLCKKNFDEAPKVAQSENSNDSLPF